MFKKMVDSIRWFFTSEIGENGEISVCPRCFLTYDRSNEVCPKCGFVNTQK